METNNAESGRWTADGLGELMRRRLEEMKRGGLSAEELAARMGTSRSAVYHILNGRGVESPSLAMFLKLFPEATIFPDGGTSQSVSIGDLRGGAVNTGGNSGVIVVGGGADSPSGVTESLSGKAREAEGLIPVIDTLIMSRDMPSRKKAKLIVRMMLSFLGISGSGKEE